MLLSLHQLPSKHHYAASARPPPPSQILPSFVLRLKKSKPYTPYCQSSSGTSLSREAIAKSAIQRISEKLRSLGYLADDSVPLRTGPGSAGGIFTTTPLEIPRYRVGHIIDPSWSTPEHPVPEPGSGTVITRFVELWQSERLLSEGKKAKLPTVAVLTLHSKELKRLRKLGIALEKRIKVGKVGITEGIVNRIHDWWRKAEVVKIACYDICRINMKRTHEILERKTGGLVIWRAVNIVVLYRGTDYKYPYFHTREQGNNNLDNGSSKPAVGDIVKMNEGINSTSTSTTAEIMSAGSSVNRVHSPFVAGVGPPNKLRLKFSGEKQLEEEADRLLDGLGPRFTDWWGYDPLPVDGDLLPTVVPGLRKPFRLLPFGLQPKLTDKELTILRRLCRHIPCHFVLGRNRKLQGLAVSIIKLWEKCEVAKIAVKRGVQNTNSEMMAEELKKLTGGTLLSRNKDFIVLYRGKDFLPPAVSAAIEERRNLSSCNKTQMNNEASPSLVTHCSKATSAGLLESQIQEVAEKERSLIVLGNAKSARLTIGKVQAKLTRTAEKIKHAEKHLVRLEKLIEPTEVQFDKEGISEEERYMLRRAGLRMRPFLLLGRRGVFYGTIENMHLHWKYRELVKVLCKYQRFENVENVARTLEAESGGILVAIERVSKGYSVIIYRGKNYWGPVNLKPKALLNKKEALKCYIEAQRYKSLKLYALRLSQTRDQLECQSASNNRDTDTLHSSEYEGSTCSSDVSDKDEPIKVDFCSKPESTNNRSAQSASSGENIKEFEEVNAEPLRSNGNIASKMESIVVPYQGNLTLSEDDYNFCEIEEAEHSLVPIRSTSRSTRKEGLVGNKYGQALDATICSNSVSTEVSANSLLVETRRILDSSSVENRSRQESVVEAPFRPAPLSNRERLLLRKQALKMREHPALAIGNNNILRGVVKRIRTHFRSHPLAIVNIKGRDKGTTVQELVFELEQATGSVLVSREPGKLILYRGWSEGESSE